MEKYNQFIKCSVKSCKYNDCSENCCELDQIKVEPVQGKNTAMPDESMCSSYECQDQKNNMKTNDFFG